MKKERNDGKAAENVAALWGRFSDQLFDTKRNLIENQSWNIGTVQYSRNTYLRQK